MDGDERMVAGLMAAGLVAGRQGEATRADRSSALLPITIGTDGTGGAAGTDAGDGPSPTAQSVGLTAGGATTAKTDAAEVPSVAKSIPLPTTQFTDRSADTAPTLDNDHHDTPEAAAAPEAAAQVTGSGGHAPTLAPGGDMVSAALHGDLIRLVQDMDGDTAPVPSWVQDRELSVSDAGAVLVVVRVDQADAQEVVAQLGDLGLQSGIVVGQTVSGAVPVSSLESIATTSDVVHVRPIYILGPVAEAIGDAAPALSQRGGLGGAPHTGPHVSTTLLDLHLASNAGPLPPNWLSDRGLVSAEQGTVNVVARSDDGDAYALAVRLAAQGMTGINITGTTVSGSMPVDALVDLDTVDGLASVRPQYAITNTGSASSPGDVALGVDTARDTYGVDGSGVKVGILSDSYDVSRTAGTSEALDVASGDLPGVGNPNGYETPVQVLAEPVQVRNTIDEGRAMAQIVHDIAPGAEILFHTAFNGAADFADGIGELAEAGATVIVDDIAYLDQPFYQDGIIAQAVEDVTESGDVLYFSAVGNSGDAAYEGAWTAASDIFFTNDVLHDFDPGAGVDTRLAVSLAPGERLLLSFQWDDPFASAGGLGADTDLGIALVDGGTVVELQDDNNIASGDAFEILSYTNNSNVTQSLDLVIFLSDGPAPELVKFIAFDGESALQEYTGNSGTVFGQQAADDTIAVGAAFYEDTPALGTDPAQLESFSSRGSSTILFDENGERLDTPEVRQGPDVVAVDGVNTTFFGGSDPEQDGQPNFFGTSAAAPAAAAVAALAQEAAPDASADEIRDALESTALDMGEPGVDDESGAGLIQADAAIAALLDEPVPAEEPTAPNLVGTAGNDTLVGTAGADGLDAAAGNDIVFAEDGADSILGGSGDDELYGQIGADTLIGGLGDDALFGWVGDDVLFGDEGDDQLFGDAGNDTLDGGDGTDFVGVAALAEGFLLSRGQGDAADQVLVTDIATGDVDVLIDVETLGFTDVFFYLQPGNIDTYYYGTPFDDVVSGTSGGDGLFGDLGNDTLNGGAGDDFFDMRPGDGSDVLNGGSGNDFAGFATTQDGYTVMMVGEAAFEVIAPDGSVDTLIEVEAIGFEDAYVGLIVQTFLNADGSTWNQGTYRADSMTATANDDGLRGGDGNDTLNGGAGFDYLEGEGGSDLLQGGSGNDFAFYAGPSTGVTLARDPSGIVTVTDLTTGDVDTLVDVEAVGFEDGTVTVVAPQRWGTFLEGSIFDDTLTGEAVADGIAGGAGDDSIDGAGGADFIDGGTGADTVIGGGGDDFLVGGAGADLFVFDSTSGFDWIDDFEAGVDTIQLAAGTPFAAFEDPSGDTFLSLGADAGVRLAGVDLDTFDNDWIVIA